MLENIRSGIYSFKVYGLTACAFMELVFVIVLVTFLCAQSLSAGRVNKKYFFEGIHSIQVKL